MTFSAQVNDRGDPVCSAAWHRACASLAGERVTVTIKKWRAHRSKAQQGYYHAVVIETLRQELGYTQEEMLLTIKVQFPSYFRRWREHIAKTGLRKEIPYIRSHNDLRTLEQEHLNEEILAWAATDLGIDIPLPNEVPLEDL